VRFAGAFPDPAWLCPATRSPFAAGVSEILYAYEPVAAAFFFARQLDADATVLSRLRRRHQRLLHRPLHRKRGVLTSKALGQAGWAWPATLSTIG